MSRKRSWTDEQLVVAVSNSVSVAQVLDALGLQHTGGNHRNVKQTIECLKLSTAHFKGQGYLRGRSHMFAPSVPLKDVLIDGSSYSRELLKQRLVSEGLLNYKCCQITYYSILD